MSTIVKVWNDNVHPHVETFKGEVQTIPAGGYIEMDYVEAVQFAGQFTSPKFITDGVPDPKAYKMLRVDQPTTPVFRETNVLHATGQTAQTPAEVMAMAKAYAALHPELVAVDPEAEKSSKVTIDKTQLEGLLARVAALESQTNEKRGPGRPKKEA
jgi:hypothetical protein